MEGLCQPHQQEARQVVVCSEFDCAGSKKAGNAVIARRNYGSTSHSLFEIAFHCSAVRISASERRLQRGRRSIPITLPITSTSCSRFRRSGRSKPSEKGRTVRIFPSSTQEVQRYLLSRPSKT